MTEIIKPFRIRLKEALEHREMRAVDLCKKTRISQSTMSQYISGYAEPKKERLNLIATALNVNPTWLMGLDVSMERSNTIASASITLFNVHCENKNEAELLLAYRELSDISKQKVSSYANNLLEIERADSELSAANAIQNASTEDKQHDDDIMNDENF